MEKGDDPRQVRRSTLIYVEGLLCPPEKVTLSLDGEAQNEGRLGKGRKVADETSFVVADELDRPIMMPIVAVKQCDQRSGVDDGAWFGGSRRGWPCDWR